MNKVSLFMIAFLCFGCLFADNDINQQFEAFLQAKKQKVLDVVNQHKDAVVSVQLVVKIPAMGNWERKLEIPGTVLNESGLTIVSNSQADPMAAMKRFGQGQDATTEFSDIKIILNDGSEVEAKIVLQDEDLDIIFIKPKEAKQKFSYITLDTKSKPSVLDSVVVIAKLDASTGREPLIFHGSIMSIIKKPSTYYVMFGVSSGVPAFDENGKCFGILLNRVGGAAANMDNSNNVAAVMAMLPMVLPAEDILNVAADLEDN